MGSTFILREFNGKYINQCFEDGYIRATDMCNIFGKKFYTYRKPKRTKIFLTKIKMALKELGITTPIVQIYYGGRGKNIRVMGTWVHPIIAMDLALWLSPELSIKMREWIIYYINRDILSNLYLTK